MEQRCTIEGTVRTVVFENGENGYTVLRLATQTGELVTVVGCLPQAAPGEGMTLTGCWVSHPRHGEQFSAEEAERRLPTGETDILDYLSSGVIKGVGLATAQHLVETFGEETLSVLESEPERLTRIKGITAKRAAEMSESFCRQTGLRRLLSFLARYQLPLTHALPLLRRYGNEAAAVLRENPYCLVAEPCCVDFSHADEIAMSLDFAATDSRRTAAAILYELNYHENNGHVFLPRDKLVPATAQLLDCACEEVEEALDALRKQGSVICTPVAKVEACYLSRLYEAECYVARRLRSMLRHKKAPRSVDKLLAQVEQEQGVEYAPAQRRAMELAVTEQLLLLTGGPGTGKTTSVRGIAAVLEAMGLQVQLAAPTGRAAQRMGELCGREAQTIHRLLGMSRNPQDGGILFAKNEKDPLEADALIVDETSMVDLPLLRALLCALKPDCRLILVGDPDQLPSVGAGQVLSDLIRSEVVPVAALTEIFRQASRSAIIRTAHSINAGEALNLQNSKDGDFFFLARRESQRALDTIVELCAQRLPQKMGIPSEEIQVLSPTRKGPLGTVALNTALQAGLNPPSPERRELSWGDLLFREGDRVMQIKNNYEILWEREDGETGAGIFNGDVGQIVEIEESGEWMAVRFDERVAFYTADQFRELDMAYAMTVHKAQGSEYPAVVLAVLQAAPSLLVRGVLYTAVTRARELLVLVGDDAVVQQMAANDRRQRRFSGLRWRLRRTEET